MFSEGQDIRCPCPPLKVSQGVMIRFQERSAIVIISTLFFCRLFGQESKDFETSRCESCHKESEQEMAESVHGIKFLLAEGVSFEEAEKIAACLTCHNKHGKDDAETSNLPIRRGRDVELCGSCHAPEQAFYFESYHGRHFALKKLNNPTCTYCHVGHEPPITDPESFLHTSNVGKICAGCHGGSENGKIAMAANLSTPLTGATLYGQDVYKLSVPIKVSYSFIGLIFFAFVLTCAIELFRGNQGEISASVTHRLDKSFKAQLFLFAALYLLMDSSGIALLYSHDYGSPISYLMSKMSRISMIIYGSDDTRSLIHRLAGLTLSALFLFHLVYRLRGKKGSEGMRLRAADLKMAIQEIRFTVREYSLENHLWKRRFAYSFILFLIIMMILTGWVQWFAFSIMKFSQLQVIRYARLIHDWNGLLLSMSVYGIIVLYFGILYPFANRRKR